MNIGLEAKESEEDSIVSTSEEIEICISEEKQLIFFEVPSFSHTSSDLDVSALLFEFI